MYLLDSDHTTILQNAEGVEYARLMVNILQHGLNNLRYSIVSYHEQVLGWHAYINKARTTGEVIHGYELLGRAVRSFSRCSILPFDEAAGAIFDDLGARRVRIGTMDRRIAAIALAHDLTLVTRNVADFEKIPELRTENWTR